jgi:hypothetical protein
MNITLASTTLIITIFFWRRSHQQQACYGMNIIHIIPYFSLKNHSRIRNFNHNYCLLAQKPAAGAGVLCE